MRSPNEGNSRLQILGLCELLVQCYHQVDEELQETIEYALDDNDVPYIQAGNGIAINLEGGE